MAGKTMRSVDKTDSPAPLYGLFGITHGWGVLLTVMSPAGRREVERRIVPGPDIRVQGGPGRLTQYHERRAGALARMIEAHGIVVLDKPEWDAKKAELGEAIYA